MLKRLCRGIRSRWPAKPPPLRQLHAKQSTAALTKIEILPSSISIMGPHYNQRLLVEGTFADGHQEDLTSRATLAISNPAVAIIDKDNFALPQGDGQTTITATLQGHRAKRGHRQGLRRLQLPGVFATMCCR